MCADASGGPFGGFYGVDGGRPFLNDATHKFMDQMRMGAMVAACASKACDFRGQHVARVREWLRFFHLAGASPTDNAVVRLIGEAFIDAVAVE